MPTYEPFDWYETPLYYDIIYDVDTKKDATFLEQCYARHAQTPPPKPTASRSSAAGSDQPKPLHILEPACGSGRLMAELATRGHRVAGVDLSQGMLDFARKRFTEKGVEGRLLQAPMQDFNLHDVAKPASGLTSGGGFDLAHILVSSFKYLQNEDDAAACLNCIADHLRVGGVFVLGLHLTDPDDNNRYLERWRAKRDNLDVICTVRTDPPDYANRTEQLRSRLVVRDLNLPGAEPKRYESNWTFRTYDTAQLKSLLRKAPRLKHLATYDFNHHIDIETTLDGDDLGVVLVLQRA
jgi:SAM-dependent methyltransferase